MRIGFSNQCFSREIPIEESIDFCLAHQFNAMELNVDQTTFNPEIVKASTIEWIREIQASGTVCFSMYPSEDINFCDPVPELREDSIRRVEDAIRLASELGIATVVVHPGKVVAKNTPAVPAEAMRQNVSNIRRCSVAAKNLGVTVSVENLCHVKGTVAPDVWSFMDMCKKIDLSLIGVTLDTGHASLVDGIEDTVKEIGEYVDHIHIDDNSGQRSDHLELGKGSIDFHAVSGFLRSFQGVFNIELKRTHKDNTKEQDAGPLLRSREYLLRLLNSD